jgi:outer membrane protein
MRKICLLLLIVPILKSKAQLPSENGIRYADVEYIFSQLPAAKQIESELRSLQSQLETKIKAQYSEFEKKYSMYINTKEPDSTRRRLEKELQLMQDNIRKLQQDSEVILQRKQQQLMDPVSKKIQKAIADVAIENNFSFILNAGAGGQDLVLHAESEMDVSNLVLKKLGINPTAKQ